MNHQNPPWQLYMQHSLFTSKWIKCNWFLLLRFCVLLFQFRNGSYYFQSDGDEKKVDNDHKPVIAIWINSKNYIYWATTHIQINSLVLNVNAENESRNLQQMKQIKLLHWYKHLPNEYVYLLIVKQTTILRKFKYRYFFVVETNKQQIVASTNSLSETIQSSMLNQFEYEIKVYIDGQSVKKFPCTVYFWEWVIFIVVVVPCCYLQSKSQNYQHQSLQFIIQIWWWRHGNTKIKVFQYWFYFVFFPSFSTSLIWQSLCAMRFLFVCLFVRSVGSFAFNVK